MFMFESKLKFARFLLEGLLWLIVGAISFFVMPPSITEPALAFRRPDRSNSWWTEEDEKVLVNRLLRDDPTKGDLNNRTAVTMKGLWEAITDKDLLPVYILSWIAFIVYTSNWHKRDSWASSFGFHSNRRLIISPWHSATLATQFLSQTSWRFPAI